MKRLGRLLRSRRLAVWTIAALVAYVILATILTGLSFSSPVFIAIAVALTAETIACALERTQRVAASTRSGTVSRATIDALQERPHFELTVPDGVSPMGAVERAMRGLRLKVTRGEVLAEGRSGTWAFAGSPVFHWSLALLFVIVAAGQLTRSEGLMGVVVGTEKIDAVDSYGRLEVGLWHGDLSGMRIAVTEMPASHVANGVDQGPTPWVQLKDDAGDVLVEDYVFANSPLRHGSTLIHMNGYGLAAVLTLGGEGGITDEVLFDLDEGSPGGVVPVELTVSGPTGEDVADLRLEAAPAEDGVERMSVTYAPAGMSLDSAGASTVVLRAGEEVVLPGEVPLRVDRLTGYARLSVVDDRSVALIYGLFAIAIVSLAVAVLVPSRLVRALVVTAEDGGMMVHVNVRRSRSDAGFPRRVERAMEEALEAETIPAPQGATTFMPND